MEITKGTSQELAKAAAAGNPANAPEKRKQAVERIPMDVARLKLAIPEKEGWYRYWHLGKNVSAALRAGYRFVESADVEVEEFGLANDRAGSGSTDLGSRVSVSAGASGDEEEERLYLMELPMADHEADMRQKTARNEEIAVQLRNGAAPAMNGGSAGTEEMNHRYMKAGQELFYPKKRHSAKN